MLVAAGDTLKYTMPQVEIISEKEGVLQRRPGTELYEGIMNKYADMYLDAWRAHAVILNAKTPGVGESVTWDQGVKDVKIVNTSANPVITEAVE
jgi:hypothetical protein